MPILAVNLCSFWNRVGDALYAGWPSAHWPLSRFCGDEPLVTDGTDTPIAVRFPFTKESESDTWFKNVSELFKNKLRVWRGKLRQKEGADKLNVPLSTYRKWEIGKQTPGKLAMIEIERRMVKP